MAEDLSFHGFGADTSVLDFEGGGMAFSDGGVTFD